MGTFLEKFLQRVESAGLQLTDEELTEAQIADQEFTQDLNDPELPLVQRELLISSMGSTIEDVITAMMSARETG